MSDQVDLSQRKCIPCEGGTPPLAPAEVDSLLRLLDAWQLEQGHLVKAYAFPDFARALEFVNRVGEVAEENNHHPDVQLGWGRVRLELWSHAINGLSEADFVLAAKCDKARRKLRKKAEGKDREPGS